MATNLARTSDEWIDYFSKYNSATNNNQWVIVDPASSKNVQFLDQAFSLIKSYDLTKNLTAKGYVASYNIPFDK